MEVVADNVLSHSSSTSKESHHRLWFTYSTETINIANYMLYFITWLYAIATYSA